MRPDLAGGSTMVGPSDRRQGKPPASRDGRTHTSPSTTSQGDQRSPRGARRWLWRLLLAVAGPLLLLLALEGTLRLAGYGYETDLLLKVPNRATYGANPRYGWRFFPRAISRAPLFFSFPERKAPRSHRIFVLGASAAFGYPDASLGFSRILEVMLRSQFPNVRFEVINTSLVAINSHVVRTIAEECGRHDSDLFIVYLGNNEVIGPFGIGSRTTQPTGSLAVIRLGIWLRTTRIGQLLQQLVGKVSGRDKIRDQWRGMQMFAENEISVNDSRLAKVYAYFEENLIAIRQTAQAAGAPIIFSTVATNLRHCAPFASLHRKDLAPGALSRFETFYSAGVQAQAAADHDLAVAHFDSALAIDGQFADLHFRLGESLLALERPDRARRHIAQAKELDALRFRADNQLNDIIRAVAANQESAGVYLVDSEREFAASELTPHQLPGGELFYEHVHLTFAGNYLLARLLLPQVVASLPAELMGDGPAQPEPPSLEECAAELVYTDWNEHQMLAQLMTLLTKHPFTKQLNNRQEIAKMEAAMARLRTRASPEIQRQTFEAYASTVRKRPDDLLLRVNFVMLLNQMGRKDVARSQWRQILLTQPPAIERR